MRLPEVLTAAVGCVALAVTTCGPTTPAASSPAQSEPMSKGWLPYAQSRVRREQAAGVELREADMFSKVVADLPAGDTSSVAEFTRGSVTRLMSDGALRCRTALERPLVPLALRGTPLSVLYDLVMQDAEASSTMPPGIVGGASSPRRSSERIGQRLICAWKPATPWKRHWTGSSPSACPSTCSSP